LVLFSMGYLILRSKDPLNWFIIVGSVIYGLSSVLVFVNGDGNYLRLGAVGEITVFSLGLGYKVREENKKKIHAEQEASKTYLKLLRSQLNPHFIFNALGSIQHLLLTGDQHKAKYYLNRFSKLMRYALESSKQESALLSEEISFLEKYISLEALRFEKEFTYAINVEPPLDPEAIEVPLLVTQPFVENAIIHGLLPKKNGERHLSILFKRANYRILQCVIEDNGVGRLSNAKLQSEDKDHRSSGILIIQERLEALRQKGDEEKTVNFEDKYDKDGNPTGTRVILNYFLDF